VFATYNELAGTGSGTDIIDLTPYLVAGPYTVSFRVVSDVAASDEDGAAGFTTTIGAMTIDNLSVSGGGESYSTISRRAKTVGRRK
jgi:hypothetical protein